MRSALFIVVLLVAVAPAAAEDCSKFLEPLAYNACLARSGPPARAIHVGPAPAVHLGAAAAASRGRAPRVARPPHATLRRGRSRMVFTIRK